MVLLLQQYPRINFSEPCLFFFFFFCCSVYGDFNCVFVELLSKDVSVDESIDESSSSYSSDEEEEKKEDDLLISKVVPQHLMMSTGLYSYHVI